MRPWPEVYAELEQLRQNPQSLAYAFQADWGLQSFSLPEIERKVAPKAQYHELGAEWRRDAGHSGSIA
jgi:hypothetical protein